MTAPKPKCFCRPQVENCPVCSKPNWSAMRPSNGDALKAGLLKARLEHRKLAVAAAIVLQVIVWSGPRLTPEEAARILAKSPGLSNRTGLEGWPTILPVGPVWVVPTPPQTPAPAPRESEQGRANRMGIPGGWTPLEWAILHSGKR